MKSRLDYRDGHLCVLNESELGGDDAAAADGKIREWYAVRKAAHAEVATLVGRPVRCVEGGEGLYVDEDGTSYRLAHRGGTKPLAVKIEPLKPTPERSNADAVVLQADRQTSTSAIAPIESTLRTPGPRSAGIKPKALMRKARGRTQPLKAKRGERSQGIEPCADLAASADTAEDRVPASRKELPIMDRAPMNLREKLAEVRRRIGYIQKRGHNERFNYRYVAAADIAGAVGDLLAELGVVVIPSLESISYVPTRNSAGQIERAARVVMSYTFTDVGTSAAITVKMPGEGLDGGDKATYKAMTGALKYALLQSFLLASGDDPEDDRHEARNRGAAIRDFHPERNVSPSQITELEQLIDSTGTELERVLAYYKIASLEEMTEPVYRRALELLNRKRAAQSQQEANHAQG
jgi:hypothetical protein